MKPIIHAQGVSCNHPHAKESFDLRQVTCKACMYFLQTDPAIEKKFNEDYNLSIYETKLRMVELDASIIDRKNNEMSLKIKTPICPDCLVIMVQRKNKTTNEFFYGCRRFPNCKNTAAYIAPWLRD